MRHGDRIREGVEHSDDVVPDRSVLVVESERHKLGGGCVLVHCVETGGNTEDASIAYKRYHL